MPTDRKLAEQTLKIARMCLQRWRVFSTVSVSSMSVVISAILQLSYLCPAIPDSLVSTVSPVCQITSVSSISPLSHVSPVSTVCSFYLRTMIYRTRCIVSDGYPTMIIYLVDVR